MSKLNKKNVEDLQVKGRKVLVRVDFNVPMKDGKITNDNRIQAALPTINKLVENGAKIVLCSHLGKPKNGPEEKFSLKAAAERLAELVNTKVVFAKDDTVVGENAKKAVAGMKDGEIVVLENTRFRGAEETKNGEAFAKELADLVDDDVFVMDAFGSAHRAHASTAGVTKFVKETQATTSTSFTSATIGFNSSKRALASGLVLFIFQLPAITAFLTVFFMIQCSFRFLL